MVDRNSSNACSRKRLWQRLGEFVFQRLMPWRLQRHWVSRRMSDFRAQSDLQLVISLTSYPKRFPTLGKTIKSLLLQTVARKRVILWVAHQDVSLIPSSVVGLKRYGLEIREIDDYHSHKKYLGAFRDFPDDSIVLCDDDTYYWPSWAEELLVASIANPGVICCHRAHEVVVSEAGWPQPYDQWRYEVEGPAQGPRIFATGVGGVLYPPNCLHPTALDVNTALRLCPTADDIWLYWMARMAGKEFRQIGPRRRFFQWAGSQGQALWRINNGQDGGNDRQIAAMIKKFGSEVLDEAGGIQTSDQMISPSP